MNNPWRILIFSFRSFPLFSSTKQLRWCWYLSCISLFSRFFSFLNSFNSCAPVVFHWWRERRGRGVFKQWCKASLFDESAFDWFGWWVFFPSIFLLFSFLLWWLFSLSSWVPGGGLFLLLFYLFYKYHNYYCCGLALCWGLYILLSLFATFLLFQRGHAYFLKTTFSFVSFPVLCFFLLFSLLREGFEWNWRTEEWGVNCMVQYWSERMTKTWTPVPRPPKTPEFSHYYYYWRCYYRLKNSPSFSYIKYAP